MFLALILMPILESAVSEAKPTKNTSTQSRWGLVRPDSFHQGRFRRITAYHELEARRCVAVISGSEKQSWFARFFPSDMLLGDAASRDAVIHCVQACIPHKTILPTGVDSIITSATWTSGVAIVTAEERAHNGDDFIYNLKVEDSTGLMVERWNGLRLHAVAPIDTQRPWPAALLAPYIERRLADILPSGVYMLH